MSNRALVALRWVLTTLATAVVSRWLRYALEDRPRMRQPHEKEEEVGLSAAQYARLMQRWPVTAIYRRVVSLASQRLGMADSAPGRPPRVLDIGCGPGTLASAIAVARPHATVIGLDPSTDMLRVGRRRVVDSRVLLIQGDGAALPIKEGSIDLAVATLALHHWRDGEGVLREMRRVLHGTGQVLLFDLRRDIAVPLWLLVRLATHFVGVVGRLSGGDPAGSVAAAYTPAEAEWLAGRAGLSGVFGRGGAAWLWLEGARTSPPGPLSIDGEGESVGGG